MQQVAHASFSRITAMKRLCLVAVLAMCTRWPFRSSRRRRPPGRRQARPPKPTAKPAAAGAARTVEMTASDDMKFSVTEITAKRGETIKVVLKNVGTLPKMAMGHNFVLVKPTTKLPEFSQAGAMARDTDFIPPAMKGEVIAATAMTGPGETVEVTFKVPATAGSFPYLCSFPGHFTAGMKGMSRRQVAVSDRGAGGLPVRLAPAPYHHSFIYSLISPSPGDAWA